MLFRVVVVGWDNLAFDGHAQRFNGFWTATSDI